MSCKNISALQHSVVKKSMGCSNGCETLVVIHSRSTPANRIHAFVNELLLYECVSALPQGLFISCGKLYTRSYCQAFSLKPFHYLFFSCCKLFLCFDAEPAAGRVIDAHWSCEVLFYKCSRAGETYILK